MNKSASEVSMLFFIFFKKQGFHVVLIIHSGVTFCVFYPNSFVQEVPFSTQLPLFDTHCDPNNC